MRPPSAGSAISAAPNQELMYIHASIHINMENVAAVTSIKLPTIVGSTMRF